MWSTRILLPNSGRNSKRAYKGRMRLVVFSCFHVCEHICTFVPYFSLLICAWKVSEALLFEGDEETKEEREMVEVNEQV